MKMEPATEAAVPVVCDLCEAPYLLAPEFVRDGLVYGVLACTECVEDQLEASCASH